ncbi:MAG: hypothetical protein ACXACX_10225 [Candidatus Hodarchaeales archaeon]|jgi:hypothetical protein
MMPSKKNSRMKRREIHISRYIPQRSFQQQEIYARKPLPSSEISPFMRNQSMRKIDAPRSIKDIIAWLLSSLWPF